MKTVKNAILLLSLGLVFSCQDAIDIVQPGELYPEEAFQSVDDLEAGLKAVYGAVPGQNEIQFVSIFTDEVRIGVGNGGQGLIEGEYGFILNSNSAEANSIWSSYYFMINFANRLIEGAEFVTPQSDNEMLRYKNVIAQAHIWRAWGHFKLLQYYSTNMADDNALGVILVDFVPNITQTLPRSTNGEVFALINSDLEYVADLLPSTVLNDMGTPDDTTDDEPIYAANANNTDKKFLSNDFVKAFKARMALYREDYATAEALATELTSTYSLTPQNQYVNYWKDNNVSTDETIFRLDFVPGDGLVGGIWASVDTTVNGSPFYEMSTDLYNLLTRPNDRREDAFVSTTQTDLIKPIAKYPGSQGQTFLNDIKVFRNSEMYFIRAEARANAGDLAGVSAALQAVTAARFPAVSVPPAVVPASTAEAWAQILLERRRELCYEAHRYIDLKRLGVKANVQIQRDPADCAINGACSLSTTDYRFTMPIPFTELRANPTIRSQQNPGYGTN